MPNPAESAPTVTAAPLLRNERRFELLVRLRAAARQTPKRPRRSLRRARRNECSAPWSLIAIASAATSRCTPSLRTSRKRASIERRASRKQRTQPATLRERRPQLRHRVRRLLLHLFRMRATQRDHAILDQHAPQLRRPMLPRRKTSLEHRAQLTLPGHPPALADPTNPGQIFGTRPAPKKSGRSQSSIAPRTPPLLPLTTAP